MEWFLRYWPVAALVVFWIWMVWDGRRRRAQGALRAVNPAALGEPRGWTNGFAGDGTTLFVAGQTARDADGRIVGGGMARQWDQSLANILAVVSAAGGRPHDIARMTVFVTDLDAYRSARREIGEVWKARMGRHYPAMSVVEVKGLVDEGAVVEIEATAVIA
ncbi:MAG TPA: RidA family protein [Longimicrobiales bacterium]